mgnify:CR=1 FL=1
MVAAVTKQLNKNRSMDKKVTLAQLKEVVQEAYDQVKTNTEGKNADYIPYLANVNKDLFGISVCLLNGQTIHVGDTDYRFGIESVSKVHTAILALRQYGAKEILDKIGADATGLPFNSIIAILLENDHPSTPLVNAGAISACSMVKPIGDSAKKWDAIVGNVTDLCGSAPQLIDELYKSESDTNFNNRSIAWLLKNYNRIYDDPDMSLDLYTRQCSLGVTALQLSVAAGTIANGGVNPVTKKEVFDASLAPKITAMIAAVGFYEHTGDWMYTSGIPAKTGVGGGVMGVLPGQFGIAASPLTIDLGKSVTLTSFTYAPLKAEAKPTMAFRYKFFVSADGKNWKEVPTNGEFSNIMHNPLPQTVAFGQKVQARYIKLEATTPTATTAKVEMNEIGVKITP